MKWYETVMRDKKWVENRIKEKTERLILTTNESLTQVLWAVMKDIFMIFKKPLDVP